MEETTVKKLIQRPNDEITQRILSNINFDYKDKKESLKKYFSTKLNVYCIPTAKQRKFLKEGYSWSNKDMNFQIHIWDEVWHLGSSIEELSQPLFWLQSIKDDKILFQFWKVINKWVFGLDNWVHSDNLSHSYSRCLEFEKEKIYPQLKKWNSSNNPWARRQSVVSLLYYSRLRLHPICAQKILFLAENLIFDENYFVQRGLGWALRESYNVYPEITYQFIKKNVKNLSSIVFTTSTEKVNYSYKEELKKLRKKI